MGKVRVNISTTEGVSFSSEMITPEKGEKNDLPYRQSFILFDEEIAKEFYLGLKAHFEGE